MTSDLFKTFDQIRTQIDKLKALRNEMRRKADELSDTIAEYEQKLRLLSDEIERTIR